MRKSTLFISAVLTTFMLAVLFGVVANYNNKKVAAAVQTEAPAVAVADVLSTATELPAPTQLATILTPEQAAALVAQVLGRTDLYSVETTIFNGVNAYLVKFSSGDMVYVSPEGIILSVVLAPVPAPVVIVQSSSSGNGGGGRNGGGNGGGGGGGGDDGGGGGGEGGDD